MYLGRAVYDLPTPNPPKIGVFDGLKVVGSEIKEVEQLKLCLEGGKIE